MLKKIAITLFLLSPFLASAEVSVINNSSNLFISSSNTGTYRAICVKASNNEFVYTQGATIGDDPLYFTLYATDCRQGLTEDLKAYVFDGSCTTDLQQCISSIGANGYVVYSQPMGGDFIFDFSKSGNFANMIVANIANTVSQTISFNLYNIIFLTLGIFMFLLMVRLVRRQLQANR